MAGMTQRLIVAITGASGAVYGIRALEMLQALQVETHLIISPAGRVTIGQETDWTIGRVEALATAVYRYTDIAAAIASGSLATQGMLVAPCSIKTLSAVAQAYSDNLIVRAADVCLKEGRPVVLMVRETPLHRGHLRLMQTAAEAGAIIFPPMPAFYTRPQSIDDIVNNLVGRALARLGISQAAYKVWGEKGLGAGV